MDIGRWVTQAACHHHIVIGFDRWSVAKSTIFFIVNIFAIWIFFGVFFSIEKKKPKNDPTQDSNQGRLKFSFFFFCSNIIGSKLTIIFFHFFHSLRNSCLMLFNLSVSPGYCYAKIHFVLVVYFPGFFQKNKNSKNPMINTPSRFSKSKSNVFVS